MNLGLVFGLIVYFTTVNQFDFKHLKSWNVPSFANLNNARPAVEKPLLVGSFNIQTLSPKKFSKPEIMTTIEKVILRYDVILIMEIITTNDFHMKKLLTILNRLSEDGSVYNVTLSETHPQNKELCAFIYRTDKLQVVRSGMFEDPENLFYRKPFVVRFKALTLRDMSEFIAIGLHVKPSQAVQEMDALAKVYDSVRQTHHIEDVLLMGDFNADCDYVKEGDWNAIGLWTRTEFTWPITNGVDTTTNHKSCALDRFVFAGYNMDKGVIMPSARVFNFQEAFGLTLAEVKAVSDHWPIEIQIRSKMSKDAEAHLYSSLCVAVADLRKSNVSNSTVLSQKANSAGFTYAHDSSHQFILSKRTKTEESALDSLKHLYSVAPEVISNEQFQGINYKIYHGSLEDKSSFADLNDLIFFLRVSSEKQVITVSVCRKTTVN